MEGLTGLPSFGSNRLLNRNPAHQFIIPIIVHTEKRPPRFWRQTLFEDVGQNAYALMTRLPSENK